MKWLLLIPIVVRILTFDLDAAHLCVDSAQSKFRINAGTGGLFSAFAHDHLIEAQGIKGCAELEMSRLDQGSIELTFTTADIKVLDPDHAKDRSKVQQTMETDVLQIREFPEIHFKSSRVRTDKPGSIVVDGALTIRGKTQNVSLPLSLGEIAAGQVRAQGRYTLKQTDFGIKPYQLMGGSVKVKDELKIEFDLLLH